MSRFLDFLRRIFRVHSPSRQLNEATKFYKPLEWSTIRQQQLGGMKADFCAIDKVHKCPTPPQPDGLRVVVGSFLDEVHEITRPTQTLYADNRPVITFRADGIDAFMYSLREMARLATQAAAALCAMAAAVTDADLIAAYATPKETHYIIHGRKARTRKKYRNRVLRRARKNLKRRNRHG